MLTLADAASMLPGARRLGDGDVRITRVHTDTRTLQPGDLFVALRGERFDAHDFLPQAAAAGAAAALVSHGVALGDDGHPRPLPALVVDDTLAALQALAAAWRARHPVPLAAVTGSNGKTTVTQMVAAILQAHAGDAALATRGNLNNHIGLPLTLLRLRARADDTGPAHTLGVVELGMNHPGEIAALAAMARPDVALVNNAQREHQEFMATVEAVARENGAAIEALSASGTAVFPADDAHTPTWTALAAGRRTVTFGETPAADVHVVSASWQPAAAGAPAHWAVVLHTPLGALSAHVHLPGRHNLRNAAAAAACTFALGVPAAAIARGLDAFRAVAGRSSPTAFTAGGRTVTLVDDSYNANPDSVRAAIDLLADLPGPHWLVLGDMGEVGDQGPAFHAEVGAHARDRGLAHLWCVGAASRDAAAAFGGAPCFDDSAALAEALATGRTAVPACASALVKGSRFMRMERVVAALQSGVTGGTA